MEYKRKYNKYQQKIKNLNYITNNQCGGDNSSDNSSASKDEIDIPLIKVVNLNLTNNDIKNIENIKITKDFNITEIYERETIFDKLVSFVNNIGENESISNKLANIIKKIIESVIKNENYDSAIIWIRATVDRKNDPLFRWHRDGPYFKLDEDRPIYKFVTTLCGKSTPVITDKKIIEKFDIIENQHRELTNCIYEYSDKYKKELPYSFFKEINKLTAPDLLDVVGDNYVTAKTLEEGVYFLNMKNSNDRNSTKFGTIHSEPEIEKNRLFIAVLPGPFDKCEKWVSKK